MKSTVLPILMLCQFVCASLIISNDEESQIVSEWTADDMPDPRYDPESCGISTPGLVCDPDGVLADREFGGGPGVADKLNAQLWDIANKSECPCQSHNCYTYDALILVAIVKKLKNPDGKTSAALTTSFAKKLQEDVWKADDTDCQQEIVIAASAEDHEITTEIGEDILRSEMMMYDDVALVGGIAQSLNQPHDLVGKVKYLVKTYGIYVDHPLPDEDNSTTPEPIGEKEDSYASVLPPAVIASVVIGVLIFLGAIVIVILAPAVCHTEKWCVRLKR